MNKKQTLSIIYLLIAISICVLKIIGELKGFIEFELIGFSTILFLIALSSSIKDVEKVGFKFKNFSNLSYIIIIFLILSLFLEVILNLTANNI